MLQTLPIPTADRVLDLLPVLADALDGKGPAWLPVPAADDLETARLTAAMRPGEPITDAAALVVATSGTTGTPKGAMLSAAALRASGTATHARLGGPGQWLLALPPHHIAGLQVLLRSLAAGTEPVVLDVAAGFDPGAFAAAAAQLTGQRRYVSLVPTQLGKALADEAAATALTSFDAVLIGGAATPPPLLEQAVASGVQVMRTYGMSETCGGCVYDGSPLDGVTVKIQEGRVVLGGATLALGYRGLPSHPAFAEPGWFRTDDAGVLANGILNIVGRLDEAISTGGLTVVPQVVESVLATHPAVAECAVYGVPDERLGEHVAVAVVATDGKPPTLAELRDHVAQHLDSHAAPRELRIVTALPLRGPGKVDRAALRAG